MSNKQRLETIKALTAELAYVNSGEYKIAIYGLDIAQEAIEEEMKRTGESR